MKKSNSILFAIGCVGIVAGTLTGCKSLQDYREEQRLNEALTLLLKSNISCKEIATLCHYGSYSSFFRSFKKNYNMSPEEFRKKNL